MARYGWYLQQFLKLSAVDEFNEKNVLIWDADTIPLKPLTFFTPEGTPTFYIATEYHLPYFQAIDKLLALDKAVAHLFISQNMPIPAGWGQSCLREIEKRHACAWHEAILKEVDFKQQSGFSEYETLGTYFIHRWPSQVKFRHDRWIRNGSEQMGRRPGNADQLRSEDFEGADFVAFEWWDKRPSLAGRLKRGLLSRARRLAGKIKRRVFDRKPQGEFLRHYLADLFRSVPRLSILQIGANGGVQNDPLHEFLATKGEFRARLVEPIPEYAVALRSLYAGRDDVEIVEAAAGAEDGELTLYYLPDAVAVQMNGDGPNNNWAKGQGSFSRAQVVYWIWKNAFRGEAYRARIPEWISSIEQRAVPMRRTSDLILDDADPASTLLVVDVQGYEYNVLRGISPGKYPRWIVIEQDTGDFAASELLKEMGYSQLNNGGDILFEHRLST